MKVRMTLTKAGIAISKEVSMIRMTTIIQVAYDASSCRGGVTLKSSSELVHRNRERITGSSPTGARVHAGRALCMEERARTTGFLDSVAPPGLVQARGEPQPRARDREVASRTDTTPLVYGTRPWPGKQRTQQTHTLHRRSLQARVRPTATRFGHLQKVASSVSSSSSRHLHRHLSHAHLHRHLSHAP